MTKHIKKKKVVDFLLDRESYPHNPKSVKHIQTHSADVFIAGSYVYKIKKQVDLGFLDFSTLEKRREDCEKEIELNSRLTDGIYLGVEKISENNGSLVLGEGQRVVEYAVKMRRLPDKYFLTNLLRKSRVNKNDLKKIIKKLADFYKKQPDSDVLKKYGSISNIRSSIYGNFDVGEDFKGVTVSSACFDTLKYYNDRFFRKKEKILKKRADEGCIKDCHGDLRLEHINYSPKGINIFDCVEFNDSFRYIDVASEIAFLSMDLDFNGFKEYGRYINSEAAKILGDNTFFDVIDFYKCYRACVRGKVDSLKSQTEGVSEKESEAAIASARKYFQLALKYSLFGSSPFVIVVFGFIATGKSTVSGILSREFSANVMSSDMIRKEISGKKPTERGGNGFGGGIYTKETTEKTYNEMIRRGKKELKEGRNVILDASFSKKKYRDRVAEKFNKDGTKVIFVETTVPEKKIKQRLRDREGTDSVSDARINIFDNFKKGYEKADELKKNTYFRINTDEASCESVSRLFKDIADAAV